MVASRVEKPFGNVDMKFRSKLADLESPRPRNAAATPIADDAEILDSAVLGDGRRAAECPDESIVSVRHDDENSSRCVNLSSPKKLISGSSPFVHVFEMVMTPSEKQQIREIGGRLVLARLALGIKQKDAADRAGVSASRWANYESGERKQDTIALIKFANSYGVPLDYVLRDDRSRLPHEIYRYLEDRA